MTLGPRDTGSGGGTATSGTATSGTATGDAATRGTTTSDTTTSDTTTHGATTSDATGDPTGQGGGPGQALAERLARLGVATVYEAAGRRGLLDGDYRSLRPGAVACGPARIAACAQDDNLAVHAVMERVRPGDVLVLAMPVARPVALLGELLALQAAYRQAAAILVDAAVRDSRVLAEQGPPVWARWVRATGAAKGAMLGLDLPVELSGQRIEPGDLVLLDDDGVVVVPSADAERVTLAAEARARKEDGLRRRLSDGELSYDLHGLRP